MKNGETVAAFEKAFAEYVGAKHAIAMTNGTVTLEVALRCMGVRPGLEVQTTPLTMAATTIAILNVGGTPRYHDVDPRTWLMNAPEGRATYLPVSLYGLHAQGMGLCHVDDAAQTLRRHRGAAFTSYSLQRSKILNTGEGGVLVTDHDFLAEKARSIASLGYKLGASQSRIDSHAIRHPDYARHHRYPCMNARMNDVTAERGLRLLDAQPLGRRIVDINLQLRRECAALYRDAIAGCDWLTPQHVPEGWTHDYWTYAVATDTPARCLALLDAVEKHGGERPYPAWRLTYDEPAFQHLHPNYLHHNAAVKRLANTNLTVRGLCPNAEHLQPRLVQFQTNDLPSAERNARALRKAIEELS